MVSIVGSNIKQRRTELGMTQSELAKRMGYKNKTSVTKVECGFEAPRKEKVEKFAEALCCNPADLMGWRAGEYTSVFYDRIIQHFIVAEEKDKKAVCAILDIDYDKEFDRPE